MGSAMAVARPSGMRIGALAFQGAGLRRRLLRRVFRFGGKVGSQPLGNAALQAGGAIALTNELGGDARARELVWIRIVHDDVAVARQCGRGAVRGIAYRARQPDGAVFVWVFEASVNDDRRRCTVETVLEIFFRDAWGGHGSYCDRAARGLSIRQALQRAAAARSNGSTREVIVIGGAVSTADGAGVADTRGFASIDHPEDRLPQWVQRRKTAPDPHETPKS